MLLAPTTPPQCDAGRYWLEPAYEAAAETEIMIRPPPTWAETQRRDKARQRLKVSIYRFVTDAIEYWPRAALAEHPSPWGAVLYRASCRSTVECRYEAAFVGAGTEMEAYVQRQGVFFDTSLTLRAETPDALAAAQRSAFLSYRCNGKTVKVPLSDLTQP